MFTSIKHSMPLIRLKTLQQFKIAENNSQLLCGHNNEKRDYILRYGQTPTISKR